MLSLLFWVFALIGLLLTKLGLLFAWLSMKVAQIELWIDHALD